MKKTLRCLVAIAAVLALGLTLVGLTALAQLFAKHPATSAEVVAAALVVAILLIAVVGHQARGVPAQTVLELDLPTVPSETPAPNPLANASGRRPMTLAETVSALHRAARDKRVRGLVLQPRFARASQAVVQELRDALAALANAGKFTIACTDTFGEAGPNNGAYYLATACQEVVLGPAGELYLVPLYSEPNFYRGVLDRLGVQLEVTAREEYKSALSQMVEHGLTVPDREQRQRLIESLWSQQVGHISADRHLTPEQVRQLADSAPLLAAEALAAGLVDRLEYTDQVLTAAKQRAGPKAKLLYLADYKKRAGKGREPGKAVTVGVVQAMGEVRRSSGAPFGLTGGPVLAADKFVRQVQAAAKYRQAKAYVVRIDSPGGSAVASESMWRALVKLRETGRPVVVSMGSVAASGGYYIATAADRVVAQPGTLTGSIGVISARAVTAQAKAKLHISPDEVHTGAEPSPFSVNRPQTPAQRARTEAGVDEVYRVFTHRVAEGRKMPVEQVLQVAKGRVWTGADALGAGLVDKLGGLEDALALAVELSGAPAGARAQARSLPRKQKNLPIGRHKPSSSDDTAAPHVGGLVDGLVAPSLAGVVAGLARSAGSLAGGEPMCLMGWGADGYWLR